MPLIGFGLSHKVAPVAVREALAVSAGDVAGALATLKTMDGIAEVALLATCNRFEVYAVTPGPAGTPPVEPILGRLGGADARDYMAVWPEAEVARHLFRVAASLESQVVGEAQILGQVKDAHRAAAQAGTLGKVLSRLFSRAAEVGKKVRTLTQIGRNAVSISSSAVDLARRIFGTLEGHTILIIGAGEMAELTVEHLRGGGAGKIIVANRTAATAQELAGRFGGEAITLDALGEALVGADILIASTAAPRPILARATVAEAMVRRRRRPLFIVDIAIPRDVEPETAEIEDVYLYNIDDLQSIADQNYRARLAEAAKAEVIVDEGAAAFGRWLKGLAVVPIIESLQQQADALVQSELERLFRRMPDLSERERRLVESSMRTLSGRLMHRPLLHLKRLPEDPDGEMLSVAAQALFAGDDGDEDDTKAAEALGLLGRKGA